jgi:hypothetical protein
VVFAGPASTTRMTTMMRTTSSPLDGGGPSGRVKGGKRGFSALGYGASLAVEAAGVTVHIRGGGDTMSDGKVDCALNRRGLSPPLSLGRNPDG